MFPWCTAWPTEVTLRTVAFHLTVGGGGVVFHPSGLRVSGKGSDHRTLHRLEEVEPVRGFLTTMHENGVARGQPREPHSKDRGELAAVTALGVGVDVEARLLRTVTDARNFTNPTIEAHHRYGRTAQHNTHNGDAHIRTCSSGPLYSTRRDTRVHMCTCRTRVSVL